MNSVSSRRRPSRQFSRRCGAAPKPRRRRARSGGPASHRSRARDRPCARDDARWHPAMR